jgi:hypothetical protein
MNDVVGHRLSLIIVAAAWAATSIGARANGHDFFDAGSTAPVDLAYVGRVRDIRGHLVEGATVVFWSDLAGLTFPAVSDHFGHYRTPDIGASLKEVAVPIVPAELNATAGLPGYELARRPVLPRRNHGRVAVDFVLRSESADTPAPSAQRTLSSVPAVAAFALMGVVIGAAVRKAGHPRSKGDSGPERA